MPAFLQSERRSDAPRPVIQDHGGRRRTPDRRRFPSRSYFPERRATRFRRSEEDRRKDWPLSTRLTHDRRLPAPAPFRIAS